MKIILDKIKKFWSAHRVWSIVILAGVVLVGYLGYQKAFGASGGVRYVTARVERGSIVSTVSGTGQISSTNEVVLKAKASGDIVSVAAKNGETLSGGALILSIDSRDARQAVRDAETALAGAQLTLQKSQITNSSTNLNSDLSKAYADGFNEVVTAFSDMPTALDDINSIFNEAKLSDSSARNVNRTAWDYLETAQASYYAADNKLTENRTDFRGVNVSSSNTDIANIISETFDTVKLVGQALKDTKNYVDYMAKNMTTTSFTTEQTTLSKDTTTISGDFAALDTAETTIKNSTDAFANADIDVKTAELTVTQKENALADAQSNLADYSVRAPFPGTVAGLTLEKGDSVTAGTAVATLVTKDQFADISMNEVDVAKINVGDKATLTFDAVPDLTLNGLVSEIDPLGVETQGVVNYDVKISLGSMDPRIKPGMSVSADIVTATKDNVLTLPNSAIKSANGRSYVEIFNPPLPSAAPGTFGVSSKTLPVRVTVETGLSNDTRTEITSGLQEGDQVVVRTIAASAAAPAAPSLFGGAPATRSGNGGSRSGGNIRIGG